MKYCYLAFYIIFGICLIIGTFADLKLDQAIYNPDSRFAIFFENFAEVPMYLIAPFAGTVMFWARPTEVRKTSIITGVVWTLVTLAGSVVFLIEMGEDWFGEDFSTVALIFIGIAFAAVVLFAGQFIKKDVMIKLQPLAIMGIVYLLCMIVLGEVLKTLWGRARYRDMVNGTDGLTLDDFSLWFIPQGLTGNRSFPSGHTYSAAMTVIASSLADRFRSLKKYQPLFFIIPAIFTILTAASRLVAGAHFISDVAVGAMLSVTVYLLLKKFLQPALFKFFTA